MSTDNKFSRRHLMQVSAAIAASSSLSPFELIFKSVLDGLVAKAYAQSLGVTARNYVFLQLPGAPPRWTWCPLTPFDDEGAIAKHATVGTRFINSSTIEYKTININGINMPWMWQFDVARAGGGTRPMRELMDDILFLRGVDCGNSSHDGARELQFLPAGARASLTALSADHNSNPIPHINMRTVGSAWKSQRTKSRTNLSLTNNAYRNLLDPFMVTTPDSFTNNKNKIDQAIKNSMQSLYEASSTQHPGFDPIISSQKDALELMRRTYNNLDTEFNNTVAKYRDIINRSRVGDSNLPYLTDSRAGTFRTSYNSKGFSNLDKYFAVIEYLLVNGYSSSVAVGLRGLENFDEHTVPGTNSLFVNTMLNRVVAACILELKTVLSSKGLWGETLINYSGEFGRYPNPDGQPGTQHRSKSGTISLISGALKGREVVGNTLRSSAHGDRADNTDKAGNNIGALGMGHLSNTIASLLRTEPAVTAVSSLVKEVNGQFESILPPGRLK